MHILNVVSKTTCCVLTNSEVHIIMGNTHAIAKKSTFIKKHPTLHIQNYAGNSYSPPVIKKPVIIPGNPPL